MRTVRYLVRDRDAKYPALFDRILTDAGIRIVLTGVRMPRMNSIMKRWVQTCRHELLDRSLIWNQHHLRRSLHQFENHYNQHRPHQATHQAAPLRAVPARSSIPIESHTWISADTTASAAPLTSTGLPLEQHERNYRQAQVQARDRNSFSICSKMETLLMREIDLDSFAAARAAGGYVIDVREPDEYVVGHVPGAHPVPLAQVTSLLDDLPRSQPVYVICASGNRSQTAARQLRRGGVVAYSVAGGTGGWARTGRPMTPAPTNTDDTRRHGMLTIVSIDTPTLGDRNGAVASVDCGSSRMGR
jgi:rhodanese-related sulfurtransferase